MQVYWLEQSEAGVPTGDEWLSEGEQEVLARLRVPKRRADWRLGRWTGKRAVAARLGLSSHETLAEIEVIPAASGAPQACIAGLAGRLAMSLSHSHGVGFCVLADGGAGVGCDVEKIEARSPAFLRDYFTAAEQEMVRGRPAWDSDRILTLLWSAKESALKAWECGLRCDPRSIEATRVELEGGADWLPLEARRAGEASISGWWRGDGNFVWTVLALPAPDSPTRLDSRNS